MPLNKSHADALLSAINAEEERTRWQKQVQEPYPKLLTGYVMASEVAAHIGVHESTLPPIYSKGWHTRMNIRRGYEPVSGRIYTYKTIPLNEEENQYRTLYKTSQALAVELHGLGCYAVPHVRRTKQDIQICLFLPHMKPTGKEEETVHMSYDEPNRTKKRSVLERDIEGAAIFLAYLLHKGWVSEKEIIEGDEKTDYNTHNKWPAFGKSILTLAKSPEIQAKIHSLDEGLQETRTRG